MSSQRTSTPSVLPRCGDLRPDLRPRLRGVLHQWAFVVAVPLGVSLVIAAPHGRARFAVGIYALSVAALFGVSALYHRVTWRSLVTRRRMRRVDHALIFLLIAATYTPFALLTLNNAQGTVLLMVVWIGALVGVVVRLAWSDAPRWVTTGPYIGLGWVAVVMVPALAPALGWAAVALLLVGGMVYTIGAVFYAQRRPNPVAGVFGYHEVFHALVIVAVALHYLAVALWVLPRAAP